MVYTGNAMLATPLYEERSARGTYISTTHTLTRGVVNKLFLYVLSSQPVYVQIWRPGSDQQTYTLIGQYLVSYSDAPAMLQV